MRPSRSTRDPVLVEGQVLGGDPEVQDLAGQLGRVLRLGGVEADQRGVALAIHLDGPHWVGPVAVAEVGVVDPQGLLKLGQVGGLEEGDEGGVVVHHKVPAELVGAVAEPVGVGVAGRRQQEVTTTSAEYSSWVPSRSTATRVTVRPLGGVSSRVTWALVRQVHVGMAQGRLGADDMGVGLAVDQAGIAVEGGAADSHPRMGTGDLAVLAGQRALRPSPQPAARDLKAA
jgi:hypothetical protein